MAGGEGVESKTPGPGLKFHEWAGRRKPVPLSQVLQKYVNLQSALQECPAPKRCYNACASGGTLMAMWSQKAFLLIVVAVMGLGRPAPSFAQADSAPNSQPNPYRTIENWAKLPEGRTWGSTSSVGIAPDGSIWVAERCGANTCAGSNLPPILHFDASGKLLRSFGEGMLVFPHGMYVDREGNVWITDAQGKDGKGQQVIKFSPEGKVLLVLGKAGVAGDGPDTFNQPSDVVVAPNGDIFVADGHGAASNARIVKFSKDGTFIKAWGKKGSGPGEFNVPHAIAMDSQGRIFVGDRANNRIQIFEPDGKFVAEWKDFGRPSDVAIDKNDMIYVNDTQSTDKTNPGFQNGIRIGSVKDGKVTAFIPQTDPSIGAPEGLTADDEGNIYASYTNKFAVRRFVKK